MKLILTVISSNHQTLGSEYCKEFTEAGGTIGRGWDNFWVLPDPERFISSKHATISFMNGGFYLTDTSSNGVIVAASDTAVGKGNQIPLNEGDELYLGEYLIKISFGSSVSIDSTPSMAADTFNVTPSDHNNINDFFGETTDPLALLGGNNVDNASQSPIPTHQANPVAPASMVDAMGHTPAFKEAMSFNHDAPAQTPPPNAAPTHQLQTPPQSAGNQTFSNGIPEDWDVTGFNIAPRATQHKDAQILTTEDFPDFDDDDFFGGGNTPPPVNPAPIQTLPPQPNNPVITPPTDHKSEAIADFSDNPAVGVQQAPADDDSGLMGLLSSDEVFSTNVTGPDAIPAQQPIVEPTPIAEPELVGLNENAQSTANSPSPMDTDIRAPAQMIADQARLASNQRNHAAQPPTQPIKTTSHAPLAQSDILQQARIKLQQHDINPDLLTDEIASDWLALMPTIMTGLVDLLQARAEIKNEFRVNKTILHAQENNPLKFSANGADAINNLFIQSRPGFLQPEAAINQAFADINVHQTALLQGLRQGMMDLLKDFEPEKLEAQFDNSLKRGSLLSKMNSSKYWQLYKEMYKHFNVDSDDDFQRIFGETFAKAYDMHCAAYGQGN